MRRRRIAADAIAAIFRDDDGVTPTPLIRPAREGDEAEIVRLVKALATYEREPDAVKLDVSLLHRALFGPQPAASALVAEGPSGLVGLALWYRTFSTWTGRPGMHLEDVYVEAGSRRSGLGRRLMAELASICAEQGLARLEWEVLEWNEPAAAFYESLGAAPLDEWQTWRVAGDALAELGRQRDRP